MFAALLCALTLPLADKPAPGLTPIAVATLTRKDPIGYEKDIVPIVAAKCRVCHEGKTREGDYDMSTYAAIIKGGTRGAKVIVPGKADASQMIYRILAENECGREAYARGTPRGISLLFEQLLAHAISASPRDSEVRIRVRRTVVTPARPDAPPSYRLDVEDRGPALPSAARQSFVELELEPGTYGRPSALPLYVAAALASWQGAGFEVGDAEGGGLRVGVTFAR